MRLQAATPASSEEWQPVTFNAKRGHEVESSRACRTILDEDGFDVTPGIAGLDTAFVATAGSGDLTLALCAEYDALPSMGHACGHNIIAASAVGAAIALRPLADELKITVKVFGTPAEESGGGKIIMLRNGAFDGVHAAMMVHPAPFDLPLMPCLAISSLEARFQGIASHASAFPHLGVERPRRNDCAADGDRPSAATAA